MYIVKSKVEDAAFCSTFCLTKIKSPLILTKGEIYGGKRQKRKIYLSIIAILSLSLPNVAAIGEQTDDQCS